MLSIYQLIHNCQFFFLQVFEVDHLLYVKYLRAYKGYRIKLRGIPCCMHPQ